MNLSKYLMLTTFAFYIMTKCTDVYNTHVTDDTDKFTLMIYSLYMYAFIYFSAMCSVMQECLEDVDYTNLTGQSSTKLLGGCRVQ